MSKPCKIKPCCLNCYTVFFKLKLVSLPLEKIHRNTAAVGQVMEFTLDVLGIVKTCSKIYEHSLKNVLKFSHSGVHYQTAY